LQRDCQAVFKIIDAYSTTEYLEGGCVEYFGPAKQRGRFESKMNLGSVQGNGQAGFDIIHAYSTTELYDVRVV